MAFLTAMAMSASAQESNPYEGFKVPPLEISSKTKYTHKYIDILGSKMGPDSVFARSADILVFVAKRYAALRRPRPIDCSG